MRSTINYIAILGILFIGIFIPQSCTHDPLFIEEIDPMDVDTMSMPCDTTIIYFETDILPILVGNCAFSGCHDAASATEGIILNNYENVINTADVVPFNLDDSELYEVITENDVDDVMPPSGKMANETIALIEQWILQGAQNLHCDDNQECDTNNITYSGFVTTMFNTSCNGCHSTTAAFGGVILDTYIGVKKEVDENRLLGAINWETSYEQMPQGQDKLDECTISKIKTWIDEGAQNN